MTIPMNATSRATNTRMPSPLVGVHRNNINPRVPQQKEMTPRSTLRALSFAFTASAFRWRLWFCTENIMLSIFVKASRIRWRFRTSAAVVPRPKFPLYGNAVYQPSRTILPPAPNSITIHRMIRFVRIVIYAVAICAGLVVLAWIVIVGAIVEECVRVGCDF